MESKFYAEAISRRRIEAGLTQEALARIAGINRTTYGSIERGQRSLSNENLVRLSLALEARVEEILAEAYQAHYVSLLETEHEVRRKMGLEPRAGDEAPQSEPLPAIHTFVDSLRDLLVTLTLARRDPGPFLPTLPLGAKGTPRRRIRSTGPGKAPRR